MSAAEEAVGFDTAAFCNAFTFTAAPVSDVVAPSAVPFNPFAADTGTATAAAAAVAAAAPIKNTGTASRSERFRAVLTAVTDVLMPFQLIEFVSGAGGAGTTGLPVPA